MRSVLLIVRGILYMTGVEANVAIVTTGLMIDATIGPILVMGIVGDQMVEAVRSLDNLDLVRRPPLGGLATMSSLCTILDVSLGALGATGDLVGVKALQCEDPLPVVVLQPRVILRR